MIVKAAGPSREPTVRTAGRPVNETATDILLVVPPVAKACEPPAGVARLAAALQARGLSCRLLGCQPGGAALAAGTAPGRRRHLDEPGVQAPGGTSRGAAGCNNLSVLGPLSSGGQRFEPHPCRSSLHRDAVVGLSDYRHASLSPVRSADLIASAAMPQDNPFYPYFSRRLPDLLDGVGTVGFSLNLPQPGALHLRDDRLRQKQAPGHENCARRRAGDFLDAATRLAQSLRRPGG